MRFEVFLYILAMAIPTYLIRMIPLTFFKKKITSRFLRSFFAYIPYAVLSAMTFPAVLEATGSTATALAGLAVALLLSFCELPMLLTALGTGLAAYLVSLIPF